MEQSDNNSENRNKVKFLQYLNTIILTAIGIVSGGIFILLGNVNRNQQEFSNEMVRIKTVQENNTKNIETLSSKVNMLELNYTDYIKTWIDENYIRKPQK